MTSQLHATLLFVPGLREHVEDHWQTHLARDIAGSRTVPPLVENCLSLDARVTALDETLNKIDGDVILAAHSAGVLMVTHWARKPTRSIRGALLATPADVEMPLPAGYPAHDELTRNGWLPVPRRPLPFPAIVVASRNDPLAKFDRVASFAQSWRARLIDGGEIGHLNPAAGFGPWPLARQLIAELDQETENA